MCGIIGYTGNRSALPLLLGGLAALEYRGYDSAGVALQSDQLRIIKRRGRLAELCKALECEENLEAARCGIGHTRWATHGEPADRNAHPHGTERLALVHNGIIENYSEIGDFLKRKGYRFSSETDTEMAALLIDWFYLQSGDPKKAIFAATDMLRGSYALGVVFAAEKERIYAIRRDNPLIVAVTEAASFIASDIPALLAYTKEYYRPDDGILAVLSPGNAVFCRSDGSPVSLSTERVDFDVTAAQKGGWAHFMLKEIHEEPVALGRTVSHYLGVDGLPDFKNPLLDRNFFARFERVQILGCGTAMHAGLIGRHILENLARLPTSVEIASEFRYRDPLLSKKDLVILLSQSGETADTLAALRYAKKEGIYTLAIVNVVGSSVAREADAVLYTPAGPEIAVASTKAYSVQCALLYLLAVYFGLCRGTVTPFLAKELCRSLGKQAPESVRAILAQNDRICHCAARLQSAEHLFYIGRGVDYALCTEGSLKLKEISYIHSEAYAAGELKHGTISLIEKGTPVVAMMTEKKLAEKMISAIREVRARGAFVLLIVSAEIAEQYQIPYDERLLLPPVQEVLAPFPGVVALQLLAYHVAALKGLDVDKPRNLAKSVTVE
ncbi:MAG: glutamine--fructose-6-phosphate transaminase (isomerizing) [Ruminococcaceae bacterium]|nr:glutamine--fructose-6-phosphate transaminase (isomerizing) [Oscillospiraceae bacterium]